MAIKFTASLRVFHPTKSSEEIVNLFGLQAKFMQSFGEKRRSPKGRVLDGLYTKTYVSFPLDTAACNSLEAFLQTVPCAGHLTNEAISEIVTSGGRVEIFIGVFCEGNGGFELDPTLMSRLATIGVSLSFDIYGNGQ